MRSICGVNQWKECKADVQGDGELQWRDIQRKARMNYGLYDMQKPRNSAINKY